MLLSKAAFVALVTWSTTPPPDSLPEAVARVESAKDAADELTDAGVEALRDALDAMEDFAPEIATDLAAQNAQLDALLTLARAELARGNDEAAAAAVDEAYRCAQGAMLPVERFGPRLAEYAASRVPRAEDHRPLAVECRRPCRIYVQERLVPANVELPPGTYRVHVVARDGGEAPAPLRQRVELGAAAVTLTWPELTDEPAPVSDEAPTTPSPRVATKRLLPRGAELAGVGVGVVGVGVGGALIGIDGRCRGGGEVTGPNACSDLNDTAVAGWVTLGVGAAVLVTSVTLLAIDEARARKGGRAARRRALRGVDGPLFRF